MEQGVVISGAAEPRDSHSAGRRDDPAQSSFSGSLFDDSTTTYFPVGKSDPVDGAKREIHGLTKAQSVAAAFFPMGTPIADGKARPRLAPEYSASVSKTGSPRASDETSRGVQKSRGNTASGTGDEATARPVNPFAIPGMFPSGGFGQGVPYMFSPYTVHPDAIRWLQTYGNTGTAISKDRCSGASDVYGEHAYQFSCTLAKSADDRTRVHLHNFGKTVKTIVKIVGSLEAAFVTLRGCFYALLNAVEYGAHGWNLLRGFPVVRLVFVVFRMFWHYVKVVGRKGPLVGLLALICTYIGRALIPALKGLFRPLGTKSTETTAKIRTTFLAKNLRELSVEVDEQIVIEEPQPKLLANEKEMLMVRKKKANGLTVRGLIPRSVIEPVCGR